MRYWLLFGIWCLAIVIFPGCASLKEKAKGFMGISTKVLEEGRANAIKKTFSYDYNTCDTKVREILKKQGAYIYAQDKDKRMIAIYVSETDTTSVGIFFSELDAQNTQIEISSPSTYAKELVVKWITSGLERDTNEKQDEKTKTESELGY